MRYVNHKFGRACVHRPRREEGERRERKGGGREREGTKGLRRDTRRTKGGLDATGRGGGGEETSLGAEECRGTKRESFSVVDESRSRVFLLMIDDRCIDSSPSAL